MINTKKKIFMLVLISTGIFWFGCNQPGNAGETIDKDIDTAAVNKVMDSAEAMKKAPEASVITVSTPVPDTVYVGTSDTTIKITKGETFILGHIIANKIRPDYTLPFKKGQTVIATIKSLSKGGNVRINQIQQPGGAFDGPFGDSLSYTLKKNGDLHIIIGENQMAGDPYTGDFLLRIRVKE